MPRRFQFSLRALLIATAIIAVLVAWWSYKARQQRIAVAAIGEAGGYVLYDFQVVAEIDAAFIRRPRYWPAWLVNALGIDYFGKVQRVGLDSKQVTDADLERLKQLTALDRIDLRGSQVTDAGLEHLQELTTLKYLFLGDTKVTDAGLEHVTEMTALKLLNLENSKITDVGLARLDGLKALQWLYLKNARVTDSGVARLQEALPKCKIER